MPTFSGSFLVPQLMALGVRSVVGEALNFRLISHAQHFREAPSFSVFDKFRHLH